MTPLRHLRAHGYRSTVARQLVLDAVVDLRHATPEQILDRVHTVSPAINLSTVYRVLECSPRSGWCVTRTWAPGRPPTTPPTNPPISTSAAPPAAGCRVCRRTSPMASSPTCTSDRLPSRRDHSGISGVCAQCQARRRTPLDDGGGPPSQSAVTMVRCRTPRRRSPSHTPSRPTRGCGSGRSLALRRPAREQRALVDGRGVVDQSHLAVLAVSGGDRHPGCMH